MGWTYWDVVDLPAEIYSVLIEWIVEQQEQQARN